MRQVVLSIPVLLFLATTSAADAPRAFRLTAGAGIGDRGMPGASGRFLTSACGSGLVLGAQGMYFEEFLTFKTPDESIGSGHLVAGWETVPEGPFSLLVLAGLGGERHVLRGGRLESEDFYDQSSFFQIDHYEKRTGFGPSLLLGLDAGLSWRRRAGVSVFLGVQMAEISQPFFQAQVDLGRW